MKLLALFLASLASLALVVQAADITLYCKCSCPPHVARVLTIDKCTACTRAFCILNEVCPNVTVPAVPSLPKTAAAVDHAIGDEKLPVAPTQVAVPGKEKVTAVAAAPIDHAIDVRRNQRKDAGVEAELLLGSPFVRPRAIEGSPIDDGWVAECFQRGSYKDEIVVYMFIILVIGLLGWAVLKPHIEDFLHRYKHYHNL
ncbi:hypothetical protein HDU99_005333, partial [Rhizoclosmatium hyalinum]